MINTELIDVDGVIRDFNGRLMDIYNKYHPNNQISSLPKNWGLARHYPIGKSIEKFYREEHMEEIYSYAQVYPGVIEFLNELVRIRFVSLITD